VKTNTKFLVISHIFPDGDAVGSLLATGMVLKTMGKKTTMVIMDKTPECFDFLPGINEVKRGFDGVFDCVIVLDCSDVDRIGIKANLKTIGRIIVNIDHHPGNTYFGDVNIVDPSASSVGEILYKLFKELEIQFDTCLGECIFTSIATDTGSFKYSNTTPDCMRICSELIGVGVRPERVSRFVFETKAIKSLQLLQKALSSLKIGKDGLYAWMEVPLKIQTELKVDDEDFEGIINYARQIKGVEVGILFREMDKGVKISFRSNDWFDVGKLARELGGGGHTRASGCIVEGKYDVIKKRVLDKIRTKLSQKGLRDDGNKWHTKHS